MKTRRLSESEVVDTFTESSDVIFWTRQWALGTITDAELIEHFKTIHSAIDMNPVEVEEECFDVA